MVHSKYTRKFLGVLFRSTKIKYEFKMLEKRNDKYKVRNMFEALAGLEAGSAEGDHALGWEPRSSNRGKRVPSYLAQRTFQTLETL